MGLVLRALRRQHGWRQSDLAGAAKTSQSTVSRVERGHIGDVTVDRVRRLFGAVDARVQLAPSWRGAALERLLDEEHGQVAGAVADVLVRDGWDVDLEVTYSIFGERGSIDVLATRRDLLAALVVEVKTDLPSGEQLGRKLDEKARLAPSIVSDRLGWRPTVVGRVVVMPELMRLRRAFARMASSLGRMFPAGGHEVRQWLRAPVGPMSGAWFLSSTRRGTTRRRRGPGQRVRVPASRSGGPRSQV